MTSESLGIHRFSAEQNRFGGSNRIRCHTSPTPTFPATGRGRDKVQHVSGRSLPVVVSTLTSLPESDRARTNS